MQVLVLLCLLGVAVSNPVTFFKDCTDMSNVEGRLVSLDVTPCDSAICRFHPQSDVKVVMQFTSTKEMASVKPVAYGLYIIGGQVSVRDAPFGMTEPNSCDRFDVNCPVTAGTTVTYTTTVHVGDVTSGQRLLAQWEMHDQADRKVVCFVVPVEIL